MNEEQEREIKDPASILPFEIVLHHSTKKVERLPKAFGGRLGEGVLDIHRDYHEGSQHR